MPPGVNPLDPEERLSPIKRGGYEGGTKTLPIKDRMLRLARSGQSVPAGGKSDRYDALADSVLDQVGAVMDVELSHQIGFVSLNSLGTDY